VTSVREDAALVALLRLGRRSGPEYAELVESSTGARAALEQELTTEDGQGTLLPPDADANVVEDVLQDVDVVDGKASAEIAGGGWIGDAAGAESVEEDGIIAAQLNVLQAVAIAQGVVGDVEHMIGLMVGQVNLEQVQPPINGLN